jgi:carbon storage regulator
MLILTRALGQQIIIGNNITITVLGINGRHVKLGIAADKSVSVNRSEVHERIANREKGNGSTNR